MSPNLCDLMQFSRRSVNTSTIVESQVFSRAWQCSESTFLLHLFDWWPFRSYFLRGKKEKTWQLRVDSSCRLTTLNSFYSVFKGNFSVQGVIDTITGFALSKLLAGQPALLLSVSCLIVSSLCPLRSLAIKSIKLRSRREAPSLLLMFILQLCLSAC